MLADEEYSPQMKEWVAKQLAQADKKTFAQLKSYFEQRKGPGLELLKAEEEARKTPPSSKAA